MLSTTLPTSLAQWERYFSVSFGLLNKVIPTISFGINKIELIETNLKLFRAHFFLTHTHEISILESRLLFEFFRSFAALISYSSQYSSKKMLFYLLNHDLNDQFLELLQLYTAWSIQSSMLLCDSFSDINSLYYAHYLDLIELRESILAIKNDLPQPIFNVLNQKLEKITTFFVFPQFSSSQCQLPFIQYSHINEIRKIAEGPHSSFFHGNCESKSVGIVEIHPKFTQAHFFKQNMESIIKLSHPNCIHCMGLAPYHSVNVVFDTINFDNRLNQLKSLNPSQKLIISLSIIRGLEYINELQLHHNILTSENVFIDSNFEAIISPFSLLNLTNEHSYLIPPESLTTMKEEEFNMKSKESIDVYSFGFILCEILKGGQNYSHNSVQMAAKIVFTNERPKIPSNASKEMKELIQKCWNSKVNKRPTITQIRTLFESNDFNLKFNDEDDISEYLKWMNQTKHMHHNKIFEIRENMKQKEIELIRNLSQLPNAEVDAIKTGIESLKRIRLTQSQPIFDLLFEILTATESIELQQKCFDLMVKLMPDISELDILDKALNIRNRFPHYSIFLVNKITNKIEITSELIDKFIQIDKSQYTLEIIKIIFFSKNRINVDSYTAAKIYETIPVEIASDFLITILSKYGLCVEFIPKTSQDKSLLSVYFLFLSEYTMKDINQVKTSICIDEIYQLNQFALKKIYEQLSNYMNQKTVKMTRYMSLLLFDFISQNCHYCRSLHLSLSLLNQCLSNSKVCYYISITNSIWDAVVYSIRNDEGEDLGNALTLIEKVPICVDPDHLQKLWKVLIMKYKMSKSIESAKTICSILKRKKDMSCDTLIPVIYEDMSKENEQNVITGLKIMRHMNSYHFIPMLKLPSATLQFWPNFVKLVKRKNQKICRSIGKLIMNIIKCIKDFSVDPEFLRSIIELLYDEKTSFDTAYPFIIFLANVTQVRDIVIYLKKQSFLQYLQQLPWRYENEPRISDAIEYFAMSLNYFYPVGL